MARGGSSESQRSGSTDPAPGPKCLGLPRWGIRRRRGFIPRRVTREGGTWRREGRGRRREGGGGRPSAERAPRTMCGRRRPRDRPPARRQTPAPHGVPSLGRSGDGAEVPLGRPAPRPNRAARCEGGAAPAPCRPHTSPGQRAGRGAPLLTPQGIARERAGGAGSAGGAAGPCGGAAWRRAGSCRSRLEFSTRLPPSPWKRCQAGLLPAAASCRAGAPRGPAVGVGRAGGCFSRALRRRQGAGRGGAGPLAGLRRVGEGRLAHPASPYKEGLRAGVRLDHSNEQFAWQQASHWPSGESLRGGGGAGTVAARRREGTWGCGRCARTERGAKGSGGRVALVPQSVPAHPYDCLPSAGGWRSGALRAPCASSAPKLELRAAGRSSAAVRQRPQRSTKPRAPCGAPRLLPGQPGPPAACRL